MFEHLSTIIHDWYRRTSDRQKLQHFYVVLLCVLVIIAGVATLFNNHRSGLLVTFATVVAISFVTNLLAWSLLNSFVLDKIRVQQRTNRNSNKR